MTRSEAARSLGISLSSFQRYVEPELPRVYLGDRIVLYRVEDIEHWMSKQVTVIPEHFRDRRGKPSIHVRP